MVKWVFWLAASVATVAGITETFGWTRPDPDPEFIWAAVLYALGWLMLRIERLERR